MAGWLGPDAENRGDGVTPEQLLIVLNQLLRNAARARPHLRGGLGGKAFTPPAGSKGEHAGQRRLFRGRAWEGRAWKPSALP